MDPNAEALITGPLRRKVRITNPQGLHLRPIGAVVELAVKFRSQVRIQRDEQEPVDGKSMLGLMQLGAERGTELTVEVDGPDALPALDALVDLLTNLETRVDVEEPE